MPVWINCKYTPLPPVARATGGKLLNGAGAGPPKGRQGMPTLFKPPPLSPLIIFSKIPEKIEKEEG